MSSGIGRSKRGARFTDNQRLTEMYYDTFGGFVARAAAAGFAATDTREAWIARHGATTGARNRLHQKRCSLDSAFCALRIGSIASRSPARTRLRSGLIEVAS